MTPLARACKALRLPKGLYLDRGDLPMKNAEIRAALRQQHVSAERLTLALADALAALAPTQGVDGTWDVSEVSDVWQVAAHVVKTRNLPASMIGVLAALAMLSDEGSVEPDEWGFMVEAAP